MIREAVYEGGKRDLTFWPTKVLLWIIVPHNCYFRPHNVTAIWCQWQFLSQDQQRL